MYKVFFNDRTILLTDDFLKNFQLNYGLFYKYRNIDELKDLIEFYRKLKKINTLYIFHYDIEALRDIFKSCFLYIEAGGGLVRNKEGKILVMKRRGKWDLPKGKLDKNETFQQAALREVKEECGLDELEIVYPLLSTYHSYLLNDKPVLKKTYWFDMIYTGTKEPVPQHVEDITELRWLTKNELQEICGNTYLAIIDVFRYTNLVKLI